METAHTTPESNATAQPSTAQPSTAQPTPPLVTPPYDRELMEYLWTVETSNQILIGVTIGLVIALLLLIRFRD